jgi:hypothetical protein
MRGTSDISGYRNRRTKSEKSSQPGQSNRPGLIDQQLLDELAQRLADKLGPAADRADRRPTRSDQRAALCTTRPSAYRAARGAGRRKGDRAADRPLALVGLRTRRRARRGQARVRVKTPPRILAIARGRMPTGRHTAEPAHTCACAGPAAATPAHKAHFNRRRATADPGSQCVEQPPFSRADHGEHEALHTDRHACSSCQDSTWRPPYSTAGKTSDRTGTEARRDAAQLRAAGVGLRQTQVHHPRTPRGRMDPTTS